MQKDKYYKSLRDYMLEHEVREEMRKRKVRHYKRERAWKVAGYVLTVVMTVAILYVFTVLYMAVLPD